MLVHLALNKAQQQAPAVLDSQKLARHCGQALWPNLIGLFFQNCAGHWASSIKDLWHFYAPSVRSFGVVLCS